MITGRKHTWTKTVQIGLSAHVGCALCGILRNHVNESAETCRGPVRVGLRAPTTTATDCGMSGTAARESDGSTPNAAPTTTATEDP